MNSSDQTLILGNNLGIIEQVFYHSKFLKSQIEALGLKVRDIGMEIERVAWG